MVGIRKQCNHAGCRILVEYTKKYCDKHKRLDKSKSAYDKYANRKVVGGRFFKFYHGKEWTKASQLYRINNPCCEACLADGIICKVDVVDHIVELRDDWSKRLDESNFKSLCHRHHNAKTREERRKRSTLKT